MTNVYGWNMTENAEEIDGAVFQTRTLSEEENAALDRLVENNTKINDVFHFCHGGGEERGASDDIGAVFLCGGNVDFGCNVNAEVDDFEAIAFHHHFDEIFADIVEVAANCAENDLANGLDITGNEVGLENFRACLHRSCCDEDLGNEDLIVFESYADNAHACEKAVVQDVFRGDTFFKCFGHEDFDIFCLAVLQFEGNFFQKLCVHGWFLLVLYHFK